ncbi:MAG: hypothetical protein AAGE61_12780 [Pseudomonadota bacterium]
MSARISRIRNFTISLSVVICSIAFDATVSFAQSEKCPDPLPDNFTAADLQACAAEMHETKKALNDAIANIEALEVRIERLARNQVPLGSVIAIGDYSYPSKSDSTQDGCPAGWVRFKEAEGAFIVGADSRSKNDPGEYWFRRQDGAKEVTLKPEEIPIHTHELQAIIGVRPGPHIGTDRFEIVRNRFGTTTEAVPGERPAITSTYEAGGGLPHNNMPPYIALFFCKKLSE